MLQLHLQFKLFDQKLYHRIVLDIRNVHFRVDVYLKYRIDTLHRQVIMFSLTCQTFRLHHYRVKWLCIEIVVDLEPAKIRLHYRVSFCCRLHNFYVV